MAKIKRDRGGVSPCACLGGGSPEKVKDTTQETRSLRACRPSVCGNWLLGIDHTQTTQTSHYNPA